MWSLLLPVFAVARSAVAQTLLLAIPPAPLPLGSTNTHITIFNLTDTSRSDPYAATEEPRRLMFTLFQPANCTETVQSQYMPLITAQYHDELFAQVGIPNGTFESFRLQTCEEPPMTNTAPLLVFTPGYGTSRLVYSALNQWVSAMGFNVLAIDHPYDGSIVEYPDRSTALMANVSFPDAIPGLVNARVSDISFALDSLADETVTEAIGIPTFNTTRVGVFGHSLGGSTAADAISNDTRVVAGFNMDGANYEDSVNKTKDAPYVIFAAAGHNQTEDESWVWLWNSLEGFKLQLEVTDTAHGSFADYALLANTFGIDVESLPVVEQFFGAVPGSRMLRIIRRYVAAFFYHALQGRDEVLLEGPSSDFEEVLFRNQSEPAV